jgi:hypothetical protein
MFSEINDLIKVINYYVFIVLDRMLVFSMLVQDEYHQSADDCIGDTIC